METHEFIERLHRGDEAAFREIYARHYTLLCRFANQYLADPARAEEMVDDVIFHLWEHHREIEITRGLRPYLLAAVRNRCLNELHSAAVRREQPLSTAFPCAQDREFLDTLFADPQHPLGLLLEKELEQRLRAAIGRLPDACRAAFRKSRLEHKTYPEIARELGLSVNTVKYHIRHALALLQQHFQEYLTLLLALLLVRA